MEDQERIIKVDIEHEMRQSYINYSMSVIVARALPDVRDGFKPVHRRILFGMKEMGNLVGMTVGSNRVSSKLLVMSTVSFSKSSIMASPMRLSRASVYRMAAGLSPSTLPKLPWPSTKVYLMDHSCAIRTKAKYTELSPWG